MVKLAAGDFLIDEGSGSLLSDLVGHRFAMRHAESARFKKYLRMRPRHLRILSDIVLHLVFVLGFSVCQ